MIPSGDPVPLGPGGEFDRIRAIWRRLGNVGGVGDDCAMVEIGGKRLAFSVDMSVEDVHFRTGWLAPAEIGWRSASAALSDLAAVAAAPRGLLASVGVPAHWPDEHLAELMGGVGQAAAAVGAAVWGGDLVRSESVVIDIAVIGEVDGAPAARRGAQPGDRLWVTGRLGGPAAALGSWMAGTEPDAEARERFAHPVPRVAEAAWLQRQGVRAMIDLSDGLLADARHLAAASGVRCGIELEQVPRHSSAGSSRMALLSGEEYELLAVMPRGFGDDRAAEFARQFGIPLTRVGTVEAGESVIVNDQGRVVEVSGEFGHF